VIGSSQTQRERGPLRTGGVVGAVGAISAADALRLARQTGIKLDIDGDQVSLEWPDTSAAQAVIELLRRFKPEVAELLSAERRAVVMWINDRFKSGPPGRCIHCGGAGRQDDLFVALFCGDDRADIHTSCHPRWLARQEALARAALGIERDERSRLNERTAT